MRIGMRLHGFHPLEIKWKLYIMKDERKGQLRLLFTDRLYSNMNFRILYNTVKTFLISWRENPKMQLNKYK
jgi:hypothetical protein